MYPESSRLTATMAEKALRGGIVARLREWEVGEERWEGRGEELLGREERCEGRGEGRAETVLEASMSMTASCIS